MNTILVKNLYEHHVSKITDLLFTDKILKEFLEKKTVIRHGYYGGGFDGSNCAKVLRSLDEMTLHSPMNIWNALKHCGDLKKVVHFIFYCFKRFL